MENAPEARRPASIGRRLYRGIAFALIVGLAGAGLSGVPALFLQSIFVGEAQRCIEAIEKAEAGGDVTLTCPDLFADPPVWLPVVLVGGGAAIGAAGGFAYGVLSPGRRGRDRTRPEPPWLPF
ncbi:MAG: hypothetical protein OXE50_07840 [Chloroflexi bacterium]|nr:hypothetical protein [Chloroflexota bacterium]